MTEELVVGIDLGTTNSLVARVVAGKPVIVNDGQGRPIFVPSAISFFDAEKAVVGQEAIERAPLAPDRTVLSVKRLMGQGLSDLSDSVRAQYQVPLVEDGKKLVKLRIADRLHTPQEISARVLRELKLRAEEGLGQPVTKAVITVPAWFDDAQRQATRDAGKIAGLDVLRIINEPTAASLAYGLGGKDQDGVIAVYDFGGGTFDLSLLRVQAGTFRVLATFGDTFLGGDDIDRLIVERAAAVLAAQKIDASEPRLKAQLRRAAELAKIELSARESATLAVHDPTRGVHLELTLGRADLEALIAPLVEKSLELCRRALRQAGISTREVSEVVMVGGTTRIPYVRRMVGELFGRTPHTEVNPDHVVALGAAIQADILAGGRTDVLLLDVIPLSLGIETYGGAVTKLIMANSSIPTQASEEYTTPRDNVTAIDLHVLQGERELVKDCRSLARFKLKVPPMPAGLPKVKVTFLVDADGILRVLAHEERSGAETSIEVVPVHGLTEGEVDLIMADSIENAREDVRAHQLIDLRNEAHTVVRASRRTCDQAGQMVTPAQVQEIRRMADELERLTASDDVDALRAGLEALNHAAEPLAEVILNEIAHKTLSGKRLEEVR